MGYSDNTEGETDILKLDELSYQTALTDLLNIALKVGITSVTKDKTKRQIKGFITKLYERIKDYLEKTKEENKKLILEIIDAVNQDKTPNNSKNTDQHAQSESNTGLLKPNTKTEVKTKVKTD